MADRTEHTGQDGIEQLLQQAGGKLLPSESEGLGASAPFGGAGARAAVAGAAGHADSARGAAIPAAAHPFFDETTRGFPSGDDIQLLLAQAEEAIASVAEPAGADVAGLQPFRLEDFSGAPASSEKATLDLLRDVELDLRIELGRTQMCLEDVLRLRRGSVVALDKLAGDPVDIYVNGRLIARGEVLVFNESFCVRVAELIVGEDAV